MGATIEIDTGRRMRRTVAIAADGTVTYPGYEHGDAVVMTVDDVAVVVYETGRHYFAGRGHQQYAPARISVYLWADRPIAFTDGSMSGIAMRVAEIPASTGATARAKDAAEAAAHAHARILEDAAAAEGNR